MSVKAQGQNSSKRYTLPHSHDHSCQHMTCFSLWLPFQASWVTNGSGKSKAWHRGEYTCLCLDPSHENELQWERTGASLSHSASPSCQSVGERVKGIEVRGSGMFRPNSNPASVLTSYVTLRNSFPSRTCEMGATAGTPGFTFPKQSRALAGSY